MHHDQQELLIVWEGWHLDYNKGGWLARREEVEHIGRHKMYTRFSRETCLRETGRAPIKTGWAETDRGQPEKPNVRARRVAKEYKTNARPELYASTPPLEALKVVPEFATGERGGKVVALIDVHEEGCLSNCCLKDYQPGDEHMCGLLQYSLYGTHDAAQNWEEELASTLSEGSHARACGEDASRARTLLQTVHANDITVGGERSSVELLIKMISKKYEIKKQVIGEDPDLGKSGKILNRVIEWNRDGFPIEADQRHVRKRY